MNVLQFPTTGATLRLDGNDATVTVPTVLPPTFTDLTSLFVGSYKFNQDISIWDMSNVTSMGDMLYDNTVFNQNISGWNSSLIILI